MSVTQLKEQWDTAERALSAIRSVIVGRALAGVLPDDELRSQYDSADAAAVAAFDALAVANDQPVTA